MANFFINSKRIIIAGFKNFFRNGWLNVATTSVMTLTLVVITVLLILNVVLDNVINYLETRLDISVYFQTEVTEDKVLQIKNQVFDLPEVTSVDYVSKDEGIVNLLESNNVDERGTLQKAIEEIGTNPLMHTLNIQTQSSDDYSKIRDFFNKEENKEFVSKVKIKTELIDKVNYYSKWLKYIVSGLSIMFAVISILMTFNAIRITIYNFRTEIEIMKLVGASNWFIRMPFIVEGVLYGLVACIVTLFILYPSINILSPKISNFVPNSNISKFFNERFILIFLMLIGIGVLIGGLSSSLAIRRYLKEVKVKDSKDQK